MGFLSTRLSEILFSSSSHSRLKAYVVFCDALKTLKEKHGISVNIWDDSGCGYAHSKIPETLDFPSIGLYIKGDIRTIEVNNSNKLSKKYWDCWYRNKFLNIQSGIQYYSYINDNYDHFRSAEIVDSFLLCFDAISRNQVASVGKYIAPLDSKVFVDNFIKNHTA